MWTATSGWGACPGTGSRSMRHRTGSRRPCKRTRSVSSFECLSVCVWVWVWVCVSLFECLCAGIYRSHPLPTPYPPPGLPLIWLTHPLVYTCHAKIKLHGMPFTGAEGRLLICAHHLYVCIFRKALPVANFAVNPWCVYTTFLHVFVHMYVLYAYMFNELKNSEENLYLWYLHVHVHVHSVK